MTSRLRIKLTIATIALAFGLAFGLGGAAIAGSNGSSDKNGSHTRSGTQHTRHKVKTLIFGLGDEVEGGVVGPDGEDVRVRGELVHSNLIRVRTDFIPEIFKSAEDM